MFGITEIDAADLADWMDDGRESFRLVDVRSNGEMLHGMLPGAEALPMHLIPLRLEEFRAGEKAVFYCQTGARSGQVCAFLQQHGIGEVFNLRGGIVDWYRRGYGIEAPPISGLAG